MMIYIFSYRTCRHCNGTGNCLSCINGKTVTLNSTPGAAPNYIKSITIARNISYFKNVYPPN